MEDNQLHAEVLYKAVGFDVLAPFLAKKGVLSNHKVDELKNGFEKDVDKYSMLLSDICEQGPQVQLLFLRCLMKAGCASLVPTFEARFGIELPTVSSSNCTTPGEEIGPPFINQYSDKADGGAVSCCWKNEADNADTVDRSADEIEVKIGCKFYVHTEHRIYKMGSRPKGYALIIVNQDFDDKLYHTRTGAQKDSDMLVKLFGGLGFQVEDHFNKTCAEMRSILLKFASLDHSLVDSTIIAFSSHGERNRLVGTDNEYIFMEDVLDQFNNENCQTLMGKPKLFFVQACRGDKFDNGVKAGNVTDGGKDSHARNLLIPPVARSPTWTDMVIAYSTIPEYVAMRNEHRGSWFIQVVNRVFSEHAWNQPLSVLFQRVAEEMEYFQNTEGEKQVPEIAHRGWKRDLYFNPGLYL